MQRLWLFLKSAGRWGILLMTGGAVAYLVAAFEHIFGHSLSAFVWVTLGIALFMVGAFLAWNEQFNKAILAGNPEIVIEYEKSAKHITAALFVKNLGGGNAYHVQIRDIRNNADAVVRFSEMSHLENMQMSQVTGRFENFNESAPFFSHTFDAFLRTVNMDNSLGLMESIEQHVSLEWQSSPNNIKIMLDYFNVSDMRFTAEFEIRSTNAWEEVHTVFARRYFNPETKGRFQ